MCNTRSTCSCLFRHGIVSVVLSVTFRSSVMVPFISVQIQFDVGICIECIERVQQILIEFMVGDFRQTQYLTVCNGTAIHAFHVARYRILTFPTTHILSFVICDSGRGHRINTNTLTLALTQTHAEYIQMKRFQQQL